MSYADKGAATVMTFSIFLCGCKLSGTLRSANLSTLSAAKVQKRTIGVCPLLYFFLIVIILGVVGVGHSTIGKDPGCTQVISLIDVLF